MPITVEKDFLMILANVGATTVKKSFEDESFLDKAKLAMKLLVEEKLFLQQQPEMGIITIGDEISNNPEGRDYINNYRDHLVLPNCEMLKYIDSLNPSQNSSNWIQGFYVALNFIRRETSDRARRIFFVIFNNFNEDEHFIDGFDPKMFARYVKDYGDAHLLFVGENPLKNEEWSEANASRSEQFVLKVIKECNGQYERIDSFIEKRRFNIVPPRIASFWKGDLELANMCIPIYSYTKINEKIKLVPWKTKAVDIADNLMKTSTVNVHDDHRMLMLDSQRNETDPDEIINGSKFGGQSIPISEKDEESMKYESGEKRMSIYGFVLRSQIKMEHCCGKGSQIIVPQKKEYATAFYSLVQAMDEDEYVAVVRTVRTKNHLPRMGVLFPRLSTGEIWCLAHLELPYKENVKCIEKKPIKSLNKTVTKDQSDAMDNWIDSMTVHDNDFPYLKPGSFPNVPYRYHWDATLDRAKNPANPLLPIPQYLQKYLVTPEKILKAAKPHLDRLNEVFAIPISDKKDVMAVVKKKTGFTKRDAINEGFFTPDDMDIDMRDPEDM